MLFLKSHTGLKNLQLLNECGCAILSIFFLHCATHKLQTPFGVEVFDVLIETNKLRAC